MAGRTRSPLADELGGWFKALRASLGPGVTALDIGQRMGVDTPGAPEAGRVLWSKLESGANQASSAHVREAIGRALTLTADDVSGFLRGEISPEDLAKRAKLAPVHEAADRARQAAVLLEYPAAAIDAGVAAANQNETVRQVFARILDADFQRASKATSGAAQQLGLRESNEQKQARLEAGAKRQKGSPGS